MATAASVLITQVKRRWALDTAVSDSELPDALFLDRLNEALREAADAGVLFLEEITLNLSGSTGRHTLSTRVRNVRDGTVRVDADGSGEFATELVRVTEQELRAASGATENDPAGVPAVYWVTREVTVDATLVLTVYPRAATARTNGLKLWASVSPAALTATTDNLPVQTGEERYLLPALELVCAEVGRNRGRADGIPLARELAGKWQTALRDWRASAEELGRGTVRRVHYVEEI